MKITQLFDNDKAAKCTLQLNGSDIENENGDVMAVYVVAPYSAILKDWMRSQVAKQKDVENVDVDALVPKYLLQAVIRAENMGIDMSTDDGKNDMLELLVNSTIVRNQVDNFVSNEANFINL